MGIFNSHLLFSLYFAKTNYILLIMKQEKLPYICVCVDMHIFFLTKKHFYHNFLCRFFLQVKISLLVHHEAFGTDIVTSNEFI